MSIADAVRTPDTFGSGGDEPYAAALREAGSLRVTDPARPDETIVLDVSRWSGPADDVDLSLLAGVDGPVIDIGCGPGRMLVAAARFGLPSLGVDVSRAAVAIARRSGGDVVRGSVFDPVPDEGHWDTALVIDGNIGIGGDPAALLARCAQIVRPGGHVIVETHPDVDADRVYAATVVDTSGRTSATFPWAEVGATALERHAAAAGLTVREQWCTGHRTFGMLTA